MKDMKEQYKWLVEDVKRVRDFDTVKKELKKYHHELDYMQNYSKIHTGKIRDILLDNGFIAEGGDFTIQGTVAANLHEIHPLIGSQLYQLFCANLPSVQHVITVFSMFADLRVPEEYRRINPQLKDFVVNDTVNELKKWSEHYANEELKHGTYTGIVYDDLLQYDLLEEMNEWVACESEQQCKYFIQCKLGEREISVGDFTKAVLKILVITKEFVSICELFSNVSLLSVLKKVDPLISKYVATSQSLYV
jgi:antirestriction protein